MELLPKIVSIQEESKYLKLKFNFVKQKSLRHLSTSFKLKQSFLLTKIKEINVTLIIQNFHIKRNKCSKSKKLKLTHEKPKKTETEKNRTKHFIILQFSPIFIHFQSYSSLKKKQQEQQQQKKNIHYYYHYGCLIEVNVERRAETKKKKNLKENTHYGRVLCKKKNEDGNSSQMKNECED